MTVSIAEREAAVGLELNNLQELMTKSVDDPFSDFNRLKHESLLLKLSLYRTILSESEGKPQTQELCVLVDLYERRLDAMLISANDASQYMQGVMKRFGTSICNNPGDFSLAQQVLNDKQSWLAAQTERVYLEIMQVLGLDVDTKAAQNQRKLNRLQPILEYVNIFIMQQKLKIELHFPGNITGNNFTISSELLHLTDYMSKSDQDLLIDTFASIECKDTPVANEPPAIRLKCVIM